MQARGSFVVVFGVVKRKLTVLHRISLVVALVGSWQTDLFGQVVESRDTAFLLRKIDEFRIPMRSECQMRLTGYGGRHFEINDKGKLIARTACQIWRDHDRWRFLYTAEKFDIGGHGQPTHNVRTTETVIEPNEVKGVFIDEDFKQGSFWRGDTADVNNWTRAFPGVFQYLSFVFFGTDPSSNMRPVGELLRSGSVVRERQRV